MTVPYRAIDYNRRVFLQLVQYYVYIHSLKSSQDAFGKKNAFGKLHHNVSLVICIVKLEATIFCKYNNWWVVQMSSVNLHAVWKPLGPKICKIMQNGAVTRVVHITPRPHVINEDWLRQEERAMMVCVLVVNTEVTFNCCSGVLEITTCCFDMLRLKLHLRIAACTAPHVT